MSVCQFITGHYTNEGSIRIYARGEDYERKIFDIVGFEPYSGVPNEAPVPNDPRITGIIDVPPGIYGEALKGLVFSGPKVVPDFRETFPERWEDDIRFVRRAMIDIRLTSGFKTPKRSLVHYTDIIPVDFTLPPLICFWDIETYSRTRIPDPSKPDQAITCITFWDTVNRHYHTLLLDDEKKKTKISPDHTVYHILEEEQLLSTAVKFLVNLKPDVLAEWGALDRDYFPPRAKFQKVKTYVFRSFCVFDMIPAYKKLYKKGSNRLKDVAFDEGIIDHIPPEVNFAELYDNDRMALVMKNKHDVEWTVELNEKKGDMIQFFWNLKNAAGLEDLQGTTYHGVLVDTRLLRQYHGKYMLPSKPKGKVKASKLIGALVKTPPKALLDWVAVVDFSRYYPNLLIGILTAMGKDWMKPLIELCEDMLTERDHYDDLLVKHNPGTPEYQIVKGKRDSVKYISEALIGYFGSTRSRLYDPVVFEGVTRPGQEGLLFAEKTCNALGYKIPYFDTDGLFVEIGLDKVEDLVNNLNNAMAGWCEDHNIKSALKLKIDRHFDRLLFKGVKKRYAGHVVWEDGKTVDYLHIVGFEYIRRDSSLVTREVQKEVFEHLLRQGMIGLKEFLQGILKKVRSGGYSLREIALSKGIHKEFKDYKPKPDYVRGSIWSNKHLKAGIRKDDQVYMIYVKRTPGYPATNVVCFLDEETVPSSFVVDYDKMIKRTIEGKVDELIAQGGLPWARVMGMKDLRSLFA